MASLHDESNQETTRTKMEQLKQSNSKKRKKKYNNKNKNKRNKLLPLLNIRTLFCFVLSMTSIVFIIINIQVSYYHHHHHKDTTFFSSNLETTTTSTKRSSRNITVQKKQKGKKIHDPYILLNKNDNNIDDNQTSSLKEICIVEPGTGEEGPAGLIALYKIQQGLKELSSTSTVTTVDDPKILCIVYTHSGRHHVVQSIVSTYGRQCDGFFAASNVTDTSLGTWDLQHEYSHYYYNESYDTMWNKVRVIWFYVYQHYLTDFDWFHIGGDDMYLIPTNLRYFIKTTSSRNPKNQSSTSTSSSSSPLPRGRYLGASLCNPKQPFRRFCGGGAGYTLNRRAVRMLVHQMFKTNNCPASPYGTIASDEDIRIGRCLEGVNIFCEDTNDHRHEIRYHHLDVQFHASWTSNRYSLWSWEKLYYFHNILTNQSKLGQISQTSISFHLDKGTIRSINYDHGIRRYHAILYQQCGMPFQQQMEKVAISRLFHSSNNDTTSSTKTLKKKDIEMKELYDKWKRIPKAGQVH